MLETVGVLAALVMVVSYAFEERGRCFTFVFAAGCAVASVYALALRAWPFFFLEAVWAVLAVRRGVERDASLRPSRTTPRKELAMPREPIPSVDESSGLDPLAVCSLSAEDLAERLSWIRTEILPHAIRSEELATGLAWELADGPGLGDKLDRLVALERECCADITFAHRASATPGRRRLEVSGIDPTSEVFGLLRPDPSRARFRGARVDSRRRLAWAAGWGTAAALLVCCGLPALAVLLSGAAAAGLATLERPGMIAVSALAAGLIAYLWAGPGGSRRRDTAKSEQSCGCRGVGCS